MCVCVCVCVCGNGSIFLADGSRIYQCESLMKQKVPVVRLLSGSVGN